jgi:dTDP-4-amino-4,6-dideoxygalactose transaminase
MKTNYFKPSLTETEEMFLVDAFKSNEIGVGKYIGKFEEAWADYNKMKYGVACNSGTNALYLALKALGIGKGDEVIVPEFTMTATAWAVTYTGAKPVFIDCNDTLNIDPELIEEAISKKTKAIIPVHIYGRKCDMDSINAIAKRHNLYVVEDMAEAHGIQPTGDIACYSFYGNKILTTGEGGMCLTDNKMWANEMRLFANMYFDKERSMVHPKIGHNFRMTNMQASIGYAQVLRIDEILEKRRQIEKWFNKYIPEKYKRPNREVLWMYDFICDDNEKIKTDNMRYGFKPMSRQPDYLQSYEHLKAHKYSKHILYFIVWTDMTEEDVQKLCQELK